jgi:hypothetical protein
MPHDESGTCPGLTRDTLAGGKQDSYNIYVSTERRVFTTSPCLKKRIFKTFFITNKKVKKETHAWNFLPRIKKYVRIEFSPANKKKRREHVLQKLCPVSRVFSVENRVFSSCSP